MRKILWTITAVGALAVPVGIAAAQTDDDLVDTETPTTVVCEHEREQLRLHDGTGDQQRTQERLEAHECDDCEHARIREQVRVEDGQGQMVRNQVRVEECNGCTGDGPTGAPALGRQEHHQYQDQVREPIGNGR